MIGFRSAVLLAVLSGWPSLSVGAEDPPAWPDQLQARPARVVAVDPPEGVAFAYQTASFQLHSDDEINSVQLQKFATVIESVPAVLQALPLPLWAPPQGAKPRIVLCRDSLNYQSRGGPLGSMGYYDGRRQRVLIRADIFLHPPGDPRSRLLPQPNEDLLVHELTHLGMHTILGRTDPWLSEGFAEYLSVAHTRGGGYDFTRMPTAIREHIRRHLPPDERNQIVLPSLDTLLATSSRDWMDANRQAEGHAMYRPYAASLLLVHYQLQGKDRSAALRAFLQAVLAHRDRSRALPRLEIGPTGEIQELLTKYWTPKGLHLRFEKP